MCICDGTAAGHANKRCDNPPRMCSLRTCWMYPMCQSITSHGHASAAVDLLSTPFEGASTAGGGGHHVRGSRVGFSPSDVLISHRLGFDFAAF